MTIQTITKYEANGGSIHKIRLTSKTVTIAGAAPSGDVDSDIPAKVSKSNGEFGIRPRGLRLTRVVGTGATAFRQYAFVPVLTQTVWNGFEVNGTVTYDGNSWTIATKVNEDL